jgi:amino acid transporter
MLTQLAYSSWAAIVLCIIIILTNGFAVFTKGNWDNATFVSAYM